ncbi:thiolase C-terminal domain-containing protein [Natronomonas marina]|uniref:thiolase C-terminal domain-containing protein n=1 Tax=Natronomonas marina TaxID=2961939 RepID=UPI0020C9B0C5|nr:3-ketoacyl-CoA thiolase [Natronomonas marina]
MTRDAYVVGAGMVDFGTRYGDSFDDLLEEAYLSLLDDVDKGVDPRADIDAIWYGSVDLAEEGHSGATVGHATGLFEKPATQVVNACATGSDSFRNATIAVEGGRADVALVIGGEKMTDDTGGLIELAAEERVWRGRGVTMPAFFGMRATRHMEEYGTTREQISEVSVKNHANGAKYPHAHYQFECSVDDVENSPTVSYPLNLYDCCPITDGASAVLVVSEDRVDEFTDDPVRVAATSLSTDSFQRAGDTALTHFPATRNASSGAYESAGISPEDVDVAEVHDCFSIAELITYEDLGFCKEGEGGQFAAEGKSRLDGEVAVNPSGGLLSKGHPIGATGVAQISEIYEQLRGEAGDIQVDDAEVGLQHNLGIGRNSTGSVSCVTVLERP